MSVRDIVNFFREHNLAHSAAQVIQSMARPVSEDDRPRYTWRKGQLVPSDERTLVSHLLDQGDELIQRVVQQAAENNPQAFLKVAQEKGKIDWRWSSGPFGQLGRSITNNKERQRDDSRSAPTRAADPPASRLDLPAQHQRHIESALRAAAEKRTPSRDQHEAIQALLDRYFPAQ